MKFRFVKVHEIGPWSSSRLYPFLYEVERDDRKSQSKVNKPRLHNLEQVDLNYLTDNSCSELDGSLDFEVETTAAFLLSRAWTRLVGGFFNLWSDFEGEICFLAAGTLFKRKENYYKLEKKILQS